MYALFIKIMSFFVGLIPHWTVVVDTETTGIEADKELLQVSLVSGTGRVLFNKYVKPESLTEWKDAQKVNHIGPGRVKHCRPFRVYVPLVNAYLKHTKTLVGFNAERYDLPLLEEYGVETSAKVVDPMLEDAKRRTKPGEKRAKWRKLGVVARQYGYFFSAHDSLEDCFATLHIEVLTHPSVRTLLYFVRKAIRICVGAVLLLQFTSTVASPSNYSVFNYELQFVVIAVWTFVYGPVTGILSIILALAFGVSFRISVFMVILLALVLGILYGFSKPPKKWYIGLPICIACTIMGCFTCLTGGQFVLQNYFGMNPIDSNLIADIVITMVLFSPLNFIGNAIFRRVL